MKFVRMRAFAHSDSTILEFDRESTKSEVEARIRSLQECLSGVQDRALLVYAMGAQPNHRIAKLRVTPNVEVIWQRSLLPAILAPLRLLVASGACLLKVKDASILASVLQTVMEGSMVALYITRNEFAESIAQCIAETSTVSTLDFGAKRDREYAVYAIDADSFESSTGIYEIVSVGRDAPLCLQRCFRSV